MENSYLMDVVGWVGATLLAFCALPQAVESWSNKSSRGITWGMLGMWGLGEVLTLLYVLPKMDMPLLFNYLANIVFLSVIIYFKIWPKN